MVRRALLAGAAAAPPASAAGLLAGGGDAAASALLGVVVAVGNFAAHGMSLAWAAGISLPAVQAVALGGVVVRLGVIAGAFLALDRTAFFSPLVFALAVMSGTAALLAYEARLLRAGLGQGLDIPPGPAAARGREALRAREGTR